jgi:hypothetical protein
LIKQVTDSHYGSSWVLLVRDRLAKELLARVMGWGPQEVVDELDLLQTLADYKYDEYQQFSPGMRFLESLANWLLQFELDDRRVAYEFVKSRLIYCSVAEMRHLVTVAYPDHVRPKLLARAGKELGINPWHLPRIQSTEGFRMLERQTLFLGLSDGSRTDVLRRANPFLSHEQIRQSHELADERVEKLLAALRSDVEKIAGRSLAPEQRAFRCIVLVDDFSASGLSYLRKEDGTLSGKIGTFLGRLSEASSKIVDLVNLDDLEIVLVLYLATSYAKRYLADTLSNECSRIGVSTSVLVVSELPDSVRIVRGTNVDLDSLIERHYDNDNESSSTWLGGTDLKYGFAECGLPLVISHNTPNNSIGLLWAQGSVMRPLFPRVVRHRDRV